jgi:uncharacterized protein YaaQ
MKLVVGVLLHQDANQVIDALVAADYRATRINTAGGFLKRGNATLLVGVQDHQVRDAIRIIKESAHGSTGEGGVGGTGVVFVLPVVSHLRT